MSEDRQNSGLDDEEIWCAARQGDLDGPDVRLYKGSEFLFSMFSGIGRREGWLLAEQIAQMLNEHEALTERARVLEEFVASVAGSDWGDYNYQLFEFARWARELLDKSTS